MLATFGKINSSRHTPKFVSKQQRGMNFRSEVCKSANLLLTSAANIYCIRLVLSIFKSTRSIVSKRLFIDLDNLFVCCSN